MQEDVRKGGEGTAGREHDDDGEDEDGETTRCVCGFQEYPGPPVDVISSSGSHRGSRSGASGGNDGQTEEPGSLFIQCDTCEVWQHGGCVGIMTESVSPENYFCEQCKPEFHRLMKNPNG
jgi:PHD finger protein